MAELVTLAQLASAVLPEAQAVARRGTVVLTRAQFLARVRAWAAMLSRYPERECAVYARDGFEFISMLCGAWQAGKTVWLPGDVQAGTVARLQGHVSLLVGEFNGVAALTEPATTTEFPLSELAPDMPALMVFTSGSTGDPAAIPKTLRQLDAEVHALHALWGEAVGKAAVVATVPHQHFYGLLFKIFWPLCRGATFASVSLNYPEEVCACIAREPVVWIASPALLRRLPEGVPWAAQHLTAVFSSGGPLPLDAAQRCVAMLGQWPLEIYGSSETGALAWRTQAVAPAYWQTLPSVRVIRDQASGQLDVRARWLADDTPWRMGDRGEVQSDGRFTLLGRADRIAKIEEKRISLDALERVLMAVPGVREARLLQLPEGRLGAAVTLDAQGEQRLRTLGQRALSECLRAAIAVHVERVALPRRWRFVADLPRNELGKISHAGLQALFAELRPRPRLPEVRQEMCHGDRIEISLFIPPDLIYFDGHFPAAPILPGVAQVDWAVGYARRLLGLSGPFRRLEQLKFQQVIRPKMEVQLTLRHMSARLSADFRYVSAAGAHSGGRIVFGS